MKLFAKTLLALGLSLVIVSGSSLLTGCATKAAIVRTDPGTGLTSTNIEYVLPAWASNAPAILTGASQFVPPPYGEGLALLGGGLSAVLAFYLKQKNAGLKTANAALDSISTAVLSTDISEDLKRALVTAASDNSVMNHATIQTIVSKPKPDALNNLPPNLP
jgi:hypothetical protein